jgi:hypothetical protein
MGGIYPVLVHTSLADHCVEGDDIARARESARLEFPRELRDDVEAARFSSAVESAAER